MSSTKTLKVMHKDKEIEACIDKPSSAGNGHCIILTHGSGADMNQKALESAAAAVTQEGFACVRFTCKTINLVYRTKVFRSVLEHVHDAEDFKGYFVGGRAMGAKAALGLANDLGKVNYDVKGVICLAYALHPEDDKEKLNDEPLKALTVPSLFVTTVKDKTCDKEKLEEVLAKNSTAKMEWVEGPEHFRKATGRKETDVFDDVNKIIIAWCKGFVGAATEKIGAEEKTQEKTENGDDKKSKERKRKSEGGTNDGDVKKAKE